MQEQKGSKPLLLPPPEGASRKPAPPTALLLAAGFASRMKTCKALLDINGLSALERAVRNLRSGGVEEIVVVSGHYRHAVETEARRLGCSVAFNEGYERGMFSSIQRGVAALGDAAAFLLLPVDIPLVSPATIRALLAAHGEGAPLAYPTFRGTRGHPPLVGRRLFRAIADDDGTRGGLRALLAEEEDLAWDVAVADEAILLDMDSPEDYDRLRERARRGAIASDAECEALWDLAGTPENVRRHSEKVAAVADRLAASLEGKRPLDRRKLRSACLLHDLAKGEERHAEAGAQLLAHWAFDDIVSPVASHMDGPDDETLDEGALLFAADKIVKGTTLTSIEARREAVARRFGHSRDAREGAQERLDRAASLREAVARRAGRSLDEILEGLP